MKKKDQQGYDVTAPITFSDDHVALDIPEDGTQTKNGWEILPLQKTHVSLNHCMYMVLFFCASLCVKQRGDVQLNFQSVMAIQCIMQLLMKCTMNGGSKTPFY